MLVEIEVLELNNRNLSSRLLHEFRKARGPWDWLSLSTCKGVEFVKVCQRHTSHVGAAHLTYTVSTR